MNKWRKYLIVSLLVILLAALWTGIGTCGAPQVNISVKTNLGSFKLAIPVGTPENRLRNVVAGQIWGEMGPGLTKQYGSSLASALSDALARQLTPTIQSILQRYGNYVPQPQPDPKPDPKPDPRPDPRPDPKPDPQPDPKPQPAPVGLTADEARMLKLVNLEREQRGLKPLQIDMAVTAEARKKSQDMIAKNYFGHTSPTYGTPFQQMSQAGISYRAAGENLAGAPTVDRAHTSLMNSDGHRANILNPIYTHVGIGIVDGGPYGQMYTQMFIQK